MFEAVIQNADSVRVILYSDFMVFIVRMLMWNTVPSLHHNLLCINCTTTLHGFYFVWYHQWNSWINFQPKLLGKEQNHWLDVIDRVLQHSDRIFGTSLFRERGDRGRLLTIEANQFMHFLVCWTGFKVMVKNNARIRFHNPFTGGLSYFESQSIKQEYMYNLMYQ